MAGLDDDQFRLTGPMVGETDDFVADRGVFDVAADFLDDAGEVTALSRGHCLAKLPSRIIASPGLMPAALIRTRTCPGPGTGRSTSTKCRTSIPPYLSNLTARVHERSPLT